MTDEKLPPMMATDDPVDDEDDDIFSSTIDVSYCDVRRGVLRRKKIIQNLTFILCLYIRILAVYATKSFLHR